METLLKDLAKKILALDEASLSKLWDKYYNLTQNFEPTQEWEVNFLIFSFIQSVIWKNQLVNLELKKMHESSLSRPNTRFNRDKTSKIISFPSSQKNK